MKPGLKWEQSVFLLRTNYGLHSTRLKTQGRYNQPLYQCDPNRVRRTPWKNLHQLTFCRMYCVHEDMTESGVITNLFISSWYYTTVRLSLKKNNCISTCVHLGRTKAHTTVACIQAEKQFDISSSWLEYRNSKSPTGGDVSEHPAVPLPGFHSGTRRYWVAANRLRAKHAKTSQTLHRLGVSQNPRCPYCGAPKQAVDHLVLTCSFTHIRGGYHTIQECGEDF